MPSYDQMRSGPGAPSARQLDHWTTRGYLRTVYEANPGSGRSRMWEVGEDRTARLVARLTRAGLGLDAAFRVARTSAGGDPPAISYELGPGIVVRVETEL